VTVVRILENQAHLSANLAEEDPH